MNLLNRSILSAALVLTLGTGLSLAQQTSAPGPDGGQWHHRGPNPEREVKRLTKVLNLTPDQASRLEPVFANQDAQMKAIHSNGQLTQDAARQQLKALHESTQQQLASILTPDQLQQLKQMRRGPHGPGGPRGQWQGNQQPQGPPSGI